MNGHDTNNQSSPSPHRHLRTPCTPRINLWVSSPSSPFSILHLISQPLAPHLYCGTPCGGGPYPPPCPPFIPPCIITPPCPWPPCPPFPPCPPPSICANTSGLYLISCQKLHTWHPTSLYGFKLKGITGMKQKVNHSQRLARRPEKLPQF